MGPSETPPADQTPSLGRLVLLALQHVLVLYAGAVAVPLILGSALRLPREQVALLVNADLFAGGIATIIQSLGAGPFGIRLPVMMGVTFASVSPMLAMGANPALGLPGITGAVLVAGLFGTVAAPAVSRLLPFFPPVVTGSIITTIGISLMRIGITWAGGGAGIRDFGSPGYLAVSGLVLAAILLLLRYATGFVRNIAVLLGIALGYLLTVGLGWNSFDGLGHVPWIAPVLPFRLGLPRFDVAACLSMCLVMIVVMIESTGMFLALGEMTGRVVTSRDLTRGLRADGLGTLVGGLFNSFPYTSFSQNVGLVGVTGVRSRFVCVGGGVIMMLLGLLPRLAYVVASVPQCVLGGAGVVMFGMVAATGIRILSAVDYAAQRDNLFVVAISIGFGMIPLVAPNLFHALPHVLAPVLGSGILLATVAAVLLNAFFNPRPVRSTARMQEAVRSADHV